MFHLEDDKCRCAAGYIHIKDEKQRVQVSLGQTALTWDYREGIAKTIKSCAVVAEGAAAYAALRAATERALQVKFQHTWSADHDESLLETDKEDTSAADIYYMESDDEEFGRVENDEEFDVD